MSRKRSHIVCVTFPWTPDTKELYSFGQLEFTLSNFSKKVVYLRLSTELRNSHQHSLQARKMNLNTVALYLIQVNKKDRSTSCALVKFQAYASIKEVVLVSFFICSQLTFICSKSAKEILEKRLSGRNGIPIHNHLVRKQTLNHLAKLAYRVWIVCGFTETLTWHDNIQSRKRC